MSDINFSDELVTLSEILLVTIAASVARKQTTNNKHYNTDHSSTQWAISFSIAALLIIGVCYMIGIRP